MEFAPGIVYENNEIVTVLKYKDKVKLLKIYSLSYVESCKPQKIVNEAQIKNYRLEIVGD